MARKAKIDSDTLISLIDQFYAEKCDGDVGQVKYNLIGNYVRSRGYDVDDYLIRRNKDARTYIEKIQKNTEEFHISTVSVYRDIDINGFLMKNNTKEKLKEAMIERENYHRKIANSASYSFKDKKRLEHQVNELSKHIIELEKELKTSSSKIADICIENKNYKSENQKLRGIINTYVYPEIANELLKQQGLVKNTARIVNPEVIENEIVSDDTDINEIKNKVIKGLFDNILK